jgi:hypothetical protein
MTSAKACWTIWPCPIAITGKDEFEIRISKFVQMFFIPGFLLGAAGFAMLVVGQFALGKRVVKSRPARWAGAIWVSYLPLVFAARYLMAQLELDEYLHPAVIYGILLAICLPTGSIIVLRSAYGGIGRRPRPQAASVSKNPFEPLSPAASAEQSFPSAPDDFFSPPPAPLPSRSRKPARRPAPPEKNPFDFS